MKKLIVAAVCGILLAGCTVVPTPVGVGYTDPNVVVTPYVQPDVGVGLYPGYFGGGGWCCHGGWHGGHGGGGFHGGGHGHGGGHR